MGEIYKAQDTRLNRIVAIKVLSRASLSDPDSRRRFIQEAQAASSLNHPNIITIHDILSVGEDQFMVMEFVKGKTLGELIVPGGLSGSSVFLYAIQVADGLQAAHSAGIIHRDLKPGNIMVTQEGLVKILDFGLAKLTVPTGPVSLSDATQDLGPVPLTVRGAIVGTVSYMSPEQARGTNVDARSDIFSFGCVLYEMTTGRRAFAGESPLMTLTAILRDEPQPVSELVPGVPAELAGLIHRALRKEPGRRWQSMQEVRGVLVAMKQRDDSAELTVRQLPLIQPKRWGALPGLAIVALAVVFGGLWWWTIHRSFQPAPRARTNAAAENPNAPPKPSALAPALLTNQAILEMTEAHVPTSVIISQIRLSKTSFNLSPAEIIRLTKGGVTEAVIQAMHDPSGTAASSAAGAVAAAVRGHIVNIAGGTAFEIILVDNVTADCKPGQPLRFQAGEDVTAGGAVVVSKGAVVTGEVVEGARKKFLVKTTRPTFRLLDAAAVDGSSLKVRATPGRLGESRKSPPLEPIGGARSKDSPAPAGSRFLAYVDGDQTVTPRQ